MHASDIAEANRLLANRPRRLFGTMTLVLALIGLYFTSWVNYLLFHALAEGFSIVVACSFFVIAWNSRRYMQNSYLLFIGIAYLFIALIDLLHTLAYKGMPIFTDYDYYANQLWIAARYLESATLVIAFFYLGNQKAVNTRLVFVAYLLVTALLMASIFVWKIFPVCFIDGQGLTPFKKNSEYLICTLLAVSLALLYYHRHRLEGKIFRLIFGSIVCSMVSELSFTFYIDNYGLSNMVGHYFKIFSFLFLYRAIIQTGIEQPLQVIFLDLDRLNRQLTGEIEERARAEREKEGLIADLTEALEEIKTLRGVLPICMHCNRIRDDGGQWSRFEHYIAIHSDAEFSHGVCPECMHVHYPEVMQSQAR